MESVNPILKSFRLVCNLFFGIFGCSSRVIAVLMLVVAFQFTSTSQNPVVSFPEVGPEPLGNVPKNAVVLHAGWQMRESVIAGMDGRAISKVSFQAAEWYSTTVPTTVLGTLVRHGIYPDPYIGTNNMLIPDASDEHNQRYNLARFSHLPDKSNPWAKPYWFRKEFRLPANYEGKNVWLNLDGLNYRADVWLNGVKIADAKNVAGMFKRFHFEVSSHLNLAGDNALAVLIYPPDHPGDPIHEQLDGLAGSFGPNSGDGDNGRDVTQYCTLGWDWVPAVRDRNMGIWQHFWLESNGEIVVRDPAAFTDVKLPGGKEAAVTIRCLLENSTTKEQSADLLVRISPDGFTGKPIQIRSKTILPAGKTTEIILKPAEYSALVLKNPRLWWPVTYGEQPLYQLNVEVQMNGKTVSLAGSKFGVRSVGTYVSPSGGRVFTVNGRTIRMTGGAWIPDYLMSWSAQRYRDEVRLMAEGNHTVVRVNGCGIVAPEVFYDECDRRGLLVWQDLSRTSITGTYRKDGKKDWCPVDCDPALYLDNMKDCVYRLRGHSSLLVYCGSNEKVPQESVGKPLQNEILPELDGTRPWLASSDENASWSKEPTYFYSAGPYELVRLPEYFRLFGKEPKFVSKNEIGMASFLPINAVAQAIPDFAKADNSSFPLNQDFGYHDATANYFRNGDKIMREDMGEPACIGEYLWMGDLYSNLSYRAMFEAANKFRPLNSGTHLWKVNAAWPSMMWQVFDWYLRPNAGYYSMRSACLPLHIQYSADDQGIQIVSTLTAERKLRAVVSLYSASGIKKYTKEYLTTVTADATIALATLSDFVNDGNLYFLGLDLFDEKGQQVDRNVRWIQIANHFEELKSMPIAQVDVKFIGQKAINNETEYTLSVQNTSPVPAVQVFVQVIRGLQGDEVLPCFWSDNAMTLLPGEKREVSVRFRTKEHGGAEAHLMVEGWNIQPGEISVSKNERIAHESQVVWWEVNVESNAALVKFNATQKSPVGTRWNSWLVPVLLDGKIVRYVRISLKNNESSQARFTLTGLEVGEHRIVVGDNTERTIYIPDTAKK